MSKKKKRPKRRKPLRPPLSLLDKFIYSALLLLGMTLAFLPLITLIFPRRAIAFSDPAVAASSSNDINFIFVVPLAFFLGTVVLYFYSSYFANKLPIFGKRGVEYGRPPWDPTCYPLFGPRRKKVYVRPSKEADRRFTAKALLVFLAFFLLVSCLGLCGRDCLLQDGSVACYNSFNVRTKLYAPEDFSHLTLRVGSGRTTHRSIFRYWHCEVKLRTRGGKTFRFSSRGDFRDSNWLEEMARIKSRFASGNITLENLGDLDRVIDYYDMSREEAQSLRALFTQAPLS